MTDCNPCEKWKSFTSSSLAFEFHRWRSEMTSLLFHCTPNFATTTQTTPKSLDNYQETRDASIVDKEHSQCEKWLKIVYKDSPLIQFMTKELQKLGQDWSRERFMCLPCDASRAGGYNPKVGIVLCQNQMQGKKHLEHVAAHELIHAYDAVTVKLDTTNPHHHACTEIRASSLSGECGMVNQFLTGHYGFTKYHQKCVKRRAIASLKMNPYCQAPGVAESAVEDVFEACFADTAPFDEIYPM